MNVRDDRLWFFAGIAAFLSLLEFAVRTRLVSPASFAAPTEIVSATTRLFFEKSFGTDLFRTTARTCLATLVGFPIGVIVGFCMHRLRHSQALAEVVLDFVRSIPITCLIPIFIAIYGVGDQNKIAIGGFSAFLVTAVTVWISLKHCQGDRSVLLHLYKPSYRKTVRFVLLPHALPAIVTAVRLSISSALVLVIVAEMFIGTRSGIGKVVNDMTYTDDRAAQYAAVLSAGVLGYLLNLAGVLLHKLVETRFGIPEQSGS